MPKYRLFRFKPDGGRASTEIFRAKDDAEARLIACDRAGTDSYELWFDRKVIAVRDTSSQGRGGHRQ
jgi:hypothetical protein